MSCDMDTKLNIHLQLPPEVAARARTANAGHNEVAETSTTGDPVMSHPCHTTPVVTIRLEQQVGRV